MIRLVKTASNLYELKLPSLSIWFSYETPIAYMKPLGNHAYDIQITKNIWSTTTGKHLNIIDRDKTKRIENSEFNERLQKAVNA